MLVMQRGQIVSFVLYTQTVCVFVATGHQQTLTDSELRSYRLQQQTLQISKASVSARREITEFRDDENLRFSTDDLT